MDSPSDYPEGVNSENILISVFWSPKLWGNKFMLFYTNQLVVVGYDSLRTPVHRFSFFLTNLQNHMNFNSI